MNSEDLNYLPTTVGGIRIWFSFGVCRKDLNNPPTSVGGIQASSR
jgi:hypothetical protein